MKILNRWRARRQAAQGPASMSAPPEPARPAEGPLSPRLEQERRIWLKAERYRRERQERQAARAAAEAQQERERIARAQEEFEERLARALALGPAAFPGDTDEDLRAPRLTRFSIPQPWLDVQQEMDGWLRRGDRG